MATVKIGFQSVPADSTWNVQPAVGEEWCFTAFSTFGDGVSAGYAMISNAPFADPGFSMGDGDASQTCLRDAKIFIDNTHYVTIKNHASVDKYLSYSALELDVSAKVNASQPSANSGWSVQPAAGEEWLITTVVSRGDGVNYGYCNIYDGTNSSSHLLDPGLTRPAGEGTADIDCFRDGKVMIDNSSYLLIVNEDDSPEWLMYSGQESPF